MNLRTNDFRVLETFRAVQINIQSASRHLYQRLQLHNIEIIASNYEFIQSIKYGK